MSMSPQELIDTHARLGNIIFDLAIPQADRDIALVAFDEISKPAFQAALDSFRKGTPKLARLTATLYRGIRDLDRSPDAELRAIVDQLGQHLAQLHDQEGMRTTHETPEEFAEVARDEDEIPSAGAQDDLPPPPQGITRLVSFVPRDARSYADLSDEYVRFFASMEYKSPSARTEVERFARIALDNRSRYQAVGGPLGIPWWFVAGIHLLESSYNFGTHLHNGDPLKARTFRVPANRPVEGSPPFTWEESARDALVGEALDGLSDWSLARALYRWEAYNGFGYRPRGVPTPYLWSFSNVYGQGKYIGDGVFSATAVSKQIGAAVLLKALIDMGEGNDVRIERFTEGTGDGNDSSQVETDAVAAGISPNIDGQVSGNLAFRQFFEQHAADVTALRWSDFLVKGGSHATPGSAGFGLNTDPPPDKWKNVLPLARLLQKVHDRTGQKVILTSVYRSPAYNQAIDGAANSQHVRFTAADFKLAGGGGASDWRAVVQQLRSEGLFSGGIGRYDNFVHVDVRGYNANW